MKGIIKISSHSLLRESMDNSISATVTYDVKDSFKCAASNAIINAKPCPTKDISNFYVVAPNLQNGFDFRHVHFEEKQSARSNLFSPSDSDCALESILAWTEEEPKEAYSLGDIAFFILAPFILCSSTVPSKVISMSDDA